MTARKPAKNAPLIVIDLQTGMFDGIAEPRLHDADNLIDRVGNTLEWARSGQRPVAFIRHDGPQGDPLAPGEPGWPVWPAFGQQDDEPTFSKTVGDAFSNPEFRDWVEKLDVSQVILIGAQTNFCVAATVKGAMSSGLQVTVVSDTHSTVDLPDEKAAAIILRYNAQFAEAGVALLTADELTTG